MPLASLGPGSRGVAAVLATVGAVVVGGPTTAPSAAAASYGIRPLGTSIRTNGTPTAGALFPDGIGSRHTCSGTVVAMTGEAVVATAAHCVHGRAVGWSFVPGYRAGSAPFGVWRVAAAYVDPRWRDGRGSAYDVAILRLDRKRINGVPRPVNYLTGSTILSGPPAGNTIVDIAGYQVGSGDRPIGCSSKSWEQNGFGYARCSYLPTGVSGAGLRHGSDRRGHQYLGGLIGGYHQGGCDVHDAYTPAFGSWVRTLVSRAQRHAEGDTVRWPVGDGCPTARP